MSSHTCEANRSSGRARSTHLFISQVLETNAARVVLISKAGEVNNFIINIRAIFTNLRCELVQRFPPSTGCWKRRQGEAIFGWEKKPIIPSEKNTAFLVKIHFFAEKTDFPFFPAKFSEKKHYLSCKKLIFRQKNRFSTFFASCRYYNYHNFLSTVADHHCAWDTSRLSSYHNNF